MAELNFSTGLVTYSLNGKCEVSFNPTDTAFIEKVFATFNALDKKQDEYKATIAGETDSTKFFETARTMDADMRQMIDGVFGTPVSDVVFGDMNVYAYADGLPVWCNLMLTVLDVCEYSMTDEQKKTDPRISKYVAKYKKK